MTYKVASICCDMMTHNIIDTIEFTFKCLLFVCHVVTNVLRKTILSGPLESDIGKVWDMLKSWVHKAFCHNLPTNTRVSQTFMLTALTPETLIVLF